MATTRQEKKAKEANNAVKCAEILQKHNRGEDRPQRYVAYTSDTRAELTQEQIHAAFEPFADRFLNQPDGFVYTKKSRDPQKHIRELTRFVFARYRVPNHLQNVWDARFKSARYLAAGHGATKDAAINKIDWYICAAQGGSLYKEHAKPHLTKKETHTFLNCPHDLTFEEALTFSIAMTFAANAGIALRIAKSKLNACGTGEFFKNVIYFFARNPADSINEIDDLFDFIRAEVGRKVNFTMAGFTLESLRKRCKDWHHELRRVKVMGDSKWEGAAIDDVVYEDKDASGLPISWSITQIKTAKALAAEGTAQHHCVFSYRDGCAAGRCYIFSLARGDNNGMARKVTIELRNDGTIVQCRGKGNRCTTNAEHRIIQQWANDNGLHLSYYR